MQKIDWKGVGNNILRTLKRKSPEILTGVGIGGMVTFQNAKKVAATVAEIPLEYLLLETDCPYLAPDPKRGQRNSSLNLPYVAAEIAHLRGITIVEVTDATWDNAMRMYGFN